MVQVGQHIYLIGSSAYTDLPLPVVLVSGGDGNQHVVVIDDGTPKVYLSSLVKVVKYPVTARQYVRYYIERLEAYMESYPLEDPDVFDYERGVLTGLEKSLEFIPEDEDD
jgi:hypothetical protein